MKKCYKFFCFIIIILGLFLIPTTIVKAEEECDFTSEDNNCILELYKKCAYSFKDDFYKCLGFIEKMKEQGKIEEFKKIVEEQRTDIGRCILDSNDGNYEDSVAYMVQRFFDYLKILAPILVILLSGLDFAKNVISSDQDAMKKATNKLTIRLVCAIALYFVPLLTSFLINLIFNTSGNQTCNIK